MRSISSSFAVLLPLSLAAESMAADISVDPTQGQSSISPYVYGANQVEGSSVKFSSRRLGGNRLTGYNWENNFSHAGSDWQMSNDTYLCDTPSVCSAPAATITEYVDAARALGAYGLVTLQMAGYVSADDDGTVAEAQVAPSNRWKKVVARKGSAFVNSPDTSDDSVYMDELVNFLVQRYGKASAGGIQGYSLDNEPDLWDSTHPRIHPEKCGAVELVQRSAELAAAVKAVDSDAEIFGFVSYGYYGFTVLQDAEDWTTVKGKYDWYVQYYLAEMAAASAKAGRRLLDVLDLHFYSEATGNGTRITSGTTENAAARVQSTRSLWDPSYDYSANDPTKGEISWITEWNDAIRLIPRVREYIDSLYPGTKFAITEYDFGAANHISGGIAQADALGVYGKEGLYFATRWGEPGTYTDAAYRLYLDYDGNGSHFGNISVSAKSADVVNVPVYAALDASDARRLHLILINRNLTSAQTAAVKIAGSHAYTSGQSYGFDSASAQITSRDSITPVDNAFTLQLPAMSALHVVLSAATAVPITPGSGGTSGSGSGGSGGATRTSTGPALGGSTSTVGASNVGGATHGDTTQGVVAMGGATNSATHEASTNGASTHGASTNGTSTHGASTNGKATDDSGCSCRLAAPNQPRGLLVMLLAGLVLAPQRRSRRHPGVSQAESVH